MSAKNPHAPSNRLYNGEISDFREAMAAVVAECNQELTSLPRPEPEDGEQFAKDMADCRRGMVEYRQAAERALAMYDARVKEAEAVVVADLRATGDETLSRIAAALESGDYSQLAI